MEIHLEFAPFGPFGPEHWLTSCFHHGPVLCLLSFAFLLKAYVKCSFVPGYFSLAPGRRWRLPRKGAARRSRSDPPLNCGRHWRALVLQPTHNYPHRLEVFTEHQLFPPFPPKNRAISAADIGEWWCNGVLFFLECIVVRQML